MASRKILLMIKKVPPHQLGWMRVAEREDTIADKKIQIWEKPDGSLVWYDTRQGPLMLEVVKEVGGE